MDLLYGLFYEVLSEQGIWVLILIASAFAVASFILLALRMETNAKQGGTSKLGNKIQKKPIEVKAREKDKDKDKDMEKEKNILRAEESTPEPKSAPQLDPRMTPPENLTPPEIVSPGSASSKFIPKPAVEQVLEPMIDPFEVAPMPDAGHRSAPVPEKEGVSMVGQGSLAQAPQGGAISIGAAGMPDEGLLEPQKSKDGEDILALFEVEEEDTQLAEFAKRLGDVQIPSLLIETEDLVQQLKSKMKIKRRS